MAAQSEAHFHLFLKQLEHKVVALEEIITNYLQGHDVKSGHVPIIQENEHLQKMYFACRSEMPKLMALANSDLTASLMQKLIQITERINCIKDKVEPQPLKTIDTGHRIALSQSKSDLLNFSDHDDGLELIQENLKESFETKNLSFNHQNDVLFDDLAGILGRKKQPETKNLHEKKIQKKALSTASCDQGFL
jgi:hypothetical protein